MKQKELIAKFMQIKLSRLLSGLPDNTARASFARLRRGAGHIPGEIPQIWGDFLLDLPEELLGTKTKISAAEWSVYIALTLFAMHQQGKDRKTQPMHEDGISLGTAANSLVKEEKAEDKDRHKYDRQRIVNRFYPVATASDIEELSNRLRGLVTLLKSEDIALDYVMLAKDLYDFQCYNSNSMVKMKWGRDFWKEKTMNYIKEDNTK